jgi:methionine aminotransferase
MPKVNIQSKLPNLPTTIFTTMSQLANQHKAINLGQGFPDFEMDPLLHDLVNNAMRNGHNQYAHTFGFQGLREVLAQKINTLYSNPVNPETEITITPGGTYAISNALTSVLREGDEVIYFEPCFDSYVPNIKVMGAKPVAIPLNFPDYSIPWEKVRQAVNSKTRMIMVNSPNNPTGTLLGLQDLEELKDITRNTQILILSDEVYEHIVFDGEKHHSILAHPELFERSFVAFSLGKVCHCTGWKIGYSVAPAYLTKEFRNHHQFNVFSVNTPMQVAMAEYLSNPQTYLQLPSVFQAKRDFFAKEMVGSILEPLPSKGSYFQCFTFPESLGANSRNVALDLVERVGVALIPVSAFYQDETDHKVLRVCIAKKEDTLREAARRLKGVGV